MAEKQKQNNLKDSLSRLNEIVKWFSEQEEVDVETGLQKIREGAVLVKSCKARLSEIENEFKEIQSSVETELPKTQRRVRKTEVINENEEESLDNSGVNPEDLPF